MTQFLTDFSEYATGAQPTGWTQRLGTSTYLVVDDAGATGGKVLRLSVSASLHRSLSWDAVGSVSTVEIVIRFRVSTASPVMFPLKLRGAGSSGNETHYTAYFTGGGLQIYRYEFSGAAQVSTGFPTVTLTANQWYWCRMNAAAGLVQVRFWADGTAEPGTWTNSGTDGTPLAAGWVGVGALSISGGQTLDFDVVGVGTNGDVAPVPAPPPPSPPLTGRFGTIPF